MRRRPRKVFERGRLRHGEMATKTSYGCVGWFVVGGLRIMASDGKDWPPEFGPVAWEHVSVSLANRCPTWGEMDFVKSGFWEPEETVIQLHVPRSQHLNFHPNCLHLWRPLGGVEIPLPPPETVAPC